jgi:hypothetical protein
MNAIAIHERTNMTETEAESAIAGIRHHLDSAKQQAYDLWSRHGWRAVRAADGRAYTSFYDCIQDRFNDQSVSHVYRLKDIRLTELQLGRDDMKNAHVRALKQYPEAQRQRIMDKADAIAATERGVTVERHIHQAATVVAAEDAVEASGQPVVQQMVNSGEITAVTGQQMVQQLESLSPALQSGVLQIVTELGGLTDARLIKPLADMVAREGTDKPSRTLATLRATKTLAGVPLAKATMTNLQQAKAESQSQAITDSEAERLAKLRAAGKFIVQTVVVTVYRGDPKRSVRALREALGEEWYDGLRAAILEE